MRASRLKKNLPYWRIRIEAMHTAGGRTHCIASTTLSFGAHEISYRELLAALCRYFQVPLPEDAEDAINKLDQYVIGSTKISRSSGSWSFNLAPIERSKGWASERLRVLGSLAKTFFIPDFLRWPDFIREDVLLHYGFGQQPARTRLLTYGFQISRYKRGDPSSAFPQGILRCKRKGWQWNRPKESLSSPHS